MALIGTNSWDPTGESMWGISAKLAQLNYLNWVEVRRLLGTKDLKSFSCSAEQLPDVAGHSRLPALAISTGWSPAVFRASFSTWYQPPWVDDPDDRCIRDKYQTLRACVSCLAEGAHLIAHQLPDFVRCPVHREPLTSRCPECHNSLGRFLIRGPSDFVGVCLHCNKPLLHAKSASESYRDKRLRFIDSYSTWMAELRDAFSTDSQRYRWIDGPSAMSDLAHAHAVVPGLDWVDDCLVYSNRIQSSKWDWAGSSLDLGTRMHAHRIPTNAMKLLSSHDSRPRKLSASVEDYSRLIAREVQHQHDWLVGRFDLSTARSGICQLNATECTPQFGADTSAWDAAYWLWRRSLDEVFPMRCRWARSRTHLPIQLSWVWQSWVTTVGHLLWFPSKRLHQPKNAEFVRWLTPIWLARQCEESFS